MRKWYRPPSFWQDASSVWTKILWPLSQLLTILGRYRRRQAGAYHPNVPVICVGNITIGGAGKTPLVLHLATLLKQQGFQPHILSRGYGARLKKPYLVQAHSTASQVGDEPLLLAKAAPTWVFPDRIQTAKKAMQAGANCLLMDDGFQNPFVYQHIKLLVIDAAQGFGNGYTLPAGPLREPLNDAVARADAILLYGEGSLPFCPKDKPIFPVQLISSNTPSKKAYIAFAGIGRPEKFFNSLRQQGYPLIKTISFPDHYPYNPKTLNELLNLAQSQQAQLITTEKDWVRIPKTVQELIDVFKIEAHFKEDKVFNSWLLEKLQSSL